VAATVIVIDFMEDHAVYVVKKDGKFLFVQRSKQKKTLPGAWAFASGTVEEGETIEEAAKREAMEEVGVEVQPVQTFATRDLPEAGVTLHFVLCGLVAGQPKPVEKHEIENIAWHTFEDFFNTYRDDQIGHGLRWLRTQPKIWQSI
jgi:mutator protein MutT